MIALLAVAFLVCVSVATVLDGLKKWAKDRREYRDSNRAR